MITINKLVYFNRMQSFKSEIKWFNGVIKRRHTSLNNFNLNNLNQCSKFSLNRCAILNGCFSSQSIYGNIFYFKLNHSTDSIKFKNSFQNPKQPASYSNSNFKRVFSQKVIHKLNDNHQNKMRQPNQNYNDAIATLNSLQSNRAEIQMRIVNPNTLKAKVERTRTQLEYLSVNQDDLSSMNIIHISGTKGKGVFNKLCFCLSFN